MHFFSTAAKPLLFMLANVHLEVMFGASVVFNYGHLCSDVGILT